MATNTKATTKKAKKKSASKELEISYRVVEDLVPYKNNALQHDEYQVKQIADSIKEFGFLIPILVDKSDGVIAGHGRLLAASLLGLDQVPVIRAEHLTEEQKQAYVIADNKIARNSKWDESLLASELGFLQEGNFDLNLLGFSDAELGDLFSLGDLDNFDADKEWGGMPSFDSKDKTSVRALKIHFKTEKDVEEFAKVTGLNITPKTDSLWFPHKVKNVFKNKVYEDGT